MKGKVEPFFPSQQQVEKACRSMLYLCSNTSATIPNLTAMSLGALPIHCPHSCCHWLKPVPESPNLSPTNPLLSTSISLSLCNIFLAFRGAPC